MASINDQLASVKAEAEDLLAAAAKGGAVNRARLEELRHDMENLKADQDAVAETNALLKALGTPQPEPQPAPVSEKGAVSFGREVVTALAKTGALGMLSASRKATAEFISSKAAGDATTTTNAATGTGLQTLLTDIDKNIIPAYVETPSIGKWLSSGTIDGNSITFFTGNEWTAAAGRPGGAAENTKRAGVTPPPLTSVNISLKNIAGWHMITKEMAEDLSFLASEINTNLLQQLVRVEEEQFLSGTGTGNDLTGILTTAGIQSETAATAADNFDAILRAQTKMLKATGLRADGLVIHPDDYTKLRLVKDGNGQYLGGGAFTGAYGAGGVLVDPPIWGIPVIQTNAIPAGTALIGHSSAATAYRKGGLRVAASNDVNDDFLYGRFRVLAEERVALAVKAPKAFVKITLK